MTRWLGWRPVALVLLLVAGAGCGGDEKQPKLKETPGQPQLQPMMPGDRVPPEGKSIRK